MKKKNTVHPLDIFNTESPKIGTKEYDENFDQWYNEMYGFGFSAVQQGIVLALMIICVGAIIGLAIYSSVH